MIIMIATVNNITSERFYQIIDNADICIIRNDFNDLIDFLFDDQLIASVGQLQFYLFTDGHQYMYAESESLSQSDYDRPTYHTINYDISGT